MRIKGIDVNNRTISTDAAAMFGFISGNSWNKVYVFNMLSELDSPGEYFVDRDMGMLYFCSSEKIINHEISVSMLESPLFSIKS
jgi:hypothetical protein